MKKKILLIGYNYFPEPTGIGKYSGEMMQWLAQQGYECTVITAYPYYPFWKIQEPYHKIRYRYHQEQNQFASGGSITIHRCPMYVPQHPSGIKRILLDLSFLMSAFFKVLQLSLGKSTDYVMTVAPAFHFGLLGILYSKLKGAKLIYHIHDMQIEAARDLKMIKSELIIDKLFSVEKFIFERASIVSTVSEKMLYKIQDKANKEIVLFPNWVDTTVFFPIYDKEGLRRSFGFSANDIIILYSGAIGEKQGLEAIVHAAQNFVQQANIKFLICGSGPYKEKLTNLAEESKVDNVIFFPLQPADMFNKFINLADVHLVIQKSDASDLMMPSKLTTILAVGGLAIITANKGSGLHSMVYNNSIGLLAAAENQEELVECIAKAVSEDYTYMKQNARQYAEENLSTNTIMIKFEQHLS